MKLFAGAGCGTIHFSESLFPIEGFCGIHDDPVVRVLALECGEKVALISLELVMLPQEMVEMVQEIVANRLGIIKEKIWVHTTHAITTPHAPHAPVGMGGVAQEISEEVKKDLDVKIQSYTKSVMDAVTQAANAARQSFQPAVLGIGQAQSNILANRDVSTDFGWWIGRSPTGKTNPNFDLLRLDGLDRKTIAIVVTGGLKPTTIDNSQMHENKRLVSSDIPGLFCRLIEKEKAAPCLYFMGAAGDQVPCQQALLDEVLSDGTVKTHDYGVAEGLNMVTRLGRQMLDDILPELHRIHCTVDAPEISIGKTHVKWGGKGRIQMKPRKVLDFVQEREITIDGNILTIGDLAFVGLKPEVNCITAEELRQASVYERTILISMVNGGQKYMPDIASYHNITWEAQSSMMMPGAAEAWVAAVAKKLLEMKGEK